jgi:hypothetical protein
LGVGLNLLLLHQSYFLLVATFLRLSYLVKPLLLFSCERE